MVATKYIDRIVSNRLDVAFLYVDGQEYSPSSNHGYSPFITSMPGRTTTISCTARIDGNIFVIPLLHDQRRVISMMFTIEAQVMVGDDFGSIIHRGTISYKNDQYVMTTIMSYLTGGATLDIGISDDHMYVSGMNGEYQLIMIPNVSG